MSQEKGKGGRLVLAAARIAKGAVTGGLAGAAKEAVVSFLPEILKIGAAAITLVILIPLLIFIGVPHVVFGYDNAGYEDVVQLTDRAHYIGSVYENLDDYTQQYIDSLVAEYSSSEDYDEVSVDSDVSNTNVYWIIAINAVAYRQDLYAMSEDSIKKLAKNKLSISAAIESIEQTVTNDDGEEETVTIRKLKVNVKDLNPEELMEKLDFTEAEKNWARLLHQTIEAQNPLGGAYDGGYRIPPEALSDERFAAMIEEAEKYLGYPYVWGGSSPETSFDCSGYVCWVINQSGVGSVGRTTAQGLFNLCAPVTREDVRPGDLVFFYGTYVSDDTVTHVGIYVGESMMIHAGNPIGYVDFDVRYGSKLYAFGRF